MRQTLKRCCVAASVLAGTSVPGVASASSFQILEQSPSLQGTSFAGTASMAGDTSTVFFNPAGMTRLDRPELLVGGSLIVPVAEFSDAGSLRSDGFTPQSGPDSETEESAVVPSLYYVQPLGTSWRLGLGVNAPFGLASSYDEDWVGRYHATDSELQLLNFNSTLAYQATERLSLGVGVNYQRIDATLENEVDSFAACAGATGNPAGCAGGAFGAPLAPALRAQDSSVEIEADDDAFGLDLSLLYEVTDRTRIGLLWRQGVEFDLDGSADFDRSASCAGNMGCSGGLAALEGDIAADIELPDTYNLSVTHGITEHLSIHGDIAFTEWSSIQRVDIDNTGTGRNVSTLEFNYDDTMRYAFGASYNDGGPWTWRGGVAFDEAPQTDPALQTPRVPDEDRTWVSFGFSYAFSPDASIDVGYSHIFVSDAQVNNVEQGNLLAGELDPSVDIVAVSGRWRF